MSRDSNGRPGARSIPLPLPGPVEPRPCVRGEGPAPPRDHRGGAGVASAPVSETPEPPRGRRSDTSPGSVDRYSTVSSFVSIDYGSSSPNSGGCKWIGNAVRHTDDPYPREPMAKANRFRGYGRRTRRSRHHDQFRHALDGRRHDLRSGAVRAGSGRPSHLVATDPVTGCTRSATGVPGPSAGRGDLLRNAWRIRAHRRTLRKWIAWSS
jgi:hypothetical protein